MPTKLTTEQFIERANLVHGDKYDYSLVEYVNSQTIVKILCPIHGEFEQRPDKHILRKQGCWECGLELRANNRVNNAKLKFKERASLTHNNKYNYELVEYTGVYDKVKIICPIHGLFESSPNSHMNNKAGCPDCAREELGWSRSKFRQKCIKNNNGFGILYVLECFNENERFFKIGITSRSVQKRYKSESEMPYAYSVVKEIVGSPEFIYDLEIKMHREYKQYQYIPFIPFAGHLTECFSTLDIN